MLHLSCWMLSHIPINAKAHFVYCFSVKLQKKWQIIYDQRHSALRFSCAVHFLAYPVSGQRQAKLGLVLRFKLDHYSFTLHTQWDANLRQPPITHHTEARWVKCVARGHDDCKHWLEQG